MLQKKILYQIIMLSLSFYCSSALSNNFYIGVSGGPEWADFTQSATIIRPGFNYIKDKTHLSGTGAFGSILTGYAFQYHAFYFAIEGNAQANNVEHVRSNDEFVHQNFATVYYRMPHAYGLSLLPGYLLTPKTLFYARVGYAFGDIKVRSTDTSIANEHTYLNGISVGFGLHQMLNEHFSLRVECQQTNYERSRNTTYSNVIKTTKLMPTTTQTIFSLIYSFA